MNILALDLGTNTGYAIYKNNVVLSGTRKLRQSSASPAMRFIDFRLWLTSLIEKHDIKSIYFERVYRHTGTNAAHVYGGFMYTMFSVADAFCIKCVGLGVGEVKKFMAGKGNANKEEMIKAVKEKVFKVIDDNEADAISVLFLAINREGLVI